MYPDWVGSAALAIAVIWSGVLSFLLWQQGKFLNLLFPKSDSRNIRKKFEEIVRTIAEFKIKLSNLDNKVEEVKIQNLKHIQKAGLLRFNPYNDTGGNQSFVVCLLNDKGSGIIITSLHARSGTRIFGKEIKLGKSDYQLSKEEEMVLKKAMES